MSLDRGIQRTIVNGLFLLLGVYLISTGDRWLIGRGSVGLPASYFGYLLSGVAILGFLGVNVYKGGPLDRDDD